MMTVKVLSAIEQSIIDTVEAMQDADKKQYAIGIRQDANGLYHVHGSVFSGIPNKRDYYEYIGSLDNEDATYSDNYTERDFLSDQIRQEEPEEEEE